MANGQSILRGAGFIIASELSFALSAAMIKSVSASLPNESIVFFRNFFGILVLTPLLLRAGTKSLQTEHLSLHLIRSGCGLGAMYCFFYALAHISLADSMLIKSTIPLIIPFIAFMGLQESISHRVSLAGVLGFIGVGLILKPVGGMNGASLIALTSSVMAAIAFVTVRKLSATEPTLRIVTYFALTGLTLSAIPLLWAWQTPTASEWVKLMGVGLTTTIGQLLLTQGYQSAPAARVGIFTYTSVPFGTLLGWLFWNELLALNSLVGAMLILLAGSMVLKEG